jgi:hypothetical protein
MNNYLITCCDSLVAAAATERDREEISWLGLGGDDDDDTLSLSLAVYKNTTSVDACSSHAS